MRIERATLAAEMARRGWRDKRLAELAGVSRGTVSAIRCGKTSSRTTAQKIAAAFDMPLEQIIEAEM
jgi:putative transcriptional regulator